MKKKKRIKKLEKEVAALKLRLALLESPKVEMLGPFSTTDQTTGGTGRWN